MLSVIIITRNESANIADCLKSVAWADEIVVVDSGSSDDTVAICREYGCKVLETDWPGFGMQKNRALAMATQPWVLSIDADERVSPELKAELLAAMNSDEAVAGFEIPRLSSYCGRFIKHSGWHPDYVLRLFRRDKAEFTNDLVHEKVVVKGQCQKLKSSLIHYSFTSLDQVVDKMNQYSQLSAQAQFEAGKRSTVKKAVFKGAFSFLRTYILKAGFLDGSHGLMLAISNAQGTYYKYAKLALLSQPVQADKPDQ
ncbi:MAG: glycosyltransferase family 2 protein [Pontibacterium sp.]